LLLTFELEAATACKSAHRPAGVRSLPGWLPAAAGPLQIQGQQPRQNLIIAEVIRRRPTIGGKHGGTGVAIIEVAVI